MLKVHPFSWTSIRFLLLFCLIIISQVIRADISSLAKNDAFPVFSTRDPFDFLQMGERLSYRNIEWANRIKDHVYFSVSAFGQNADRGKTIKGGDTFNMTTTENDIVQLGDLTGRSSMVGLLFGKIPAPFDNDDDFAANYPNLDCARKNLFINTETDMPVIPELGSVNDGNFIDPEQNFGFFSFPLKYRKRGVRFDFGVKIYGDVGFSIQTSVATIRQIVENRENKTDESTQIFGERPPGKIQPAAGGDIVEATINETNTNRLLMNELDNIAQEIGIDICDFVDTSIEEIRFNLFWRHAFDVNPDTRDFPHFLLIPFVEITGSVSPGKDILPKRLTDVASLNEPEKDKTRDERYKLFGLPFGNNDHSAFGFSTGIHFDFIETIGFGGEVGYTHFFDKDFHNVPVPTSKFQSTIFPFKTSINVDPGANWHFAGHISAHHFLDKLSMYFQYVLIEHKEDNIQLIPNEECKDKTNFTPDPAFKPEILEKRSSFKTKLANIGFNYDFSPNVGIGFLWQTPFSQRNTYRSTTLMFGFNATF